MRAHMPPPRPHYSCLTGLDAGNQGRHLDVDCWYVLYSGYLDSEIDSPKAMLPWKSRISCTAPALHQHCKDEHYKGNLLVHEVVGREGERKREKYLAASN